jgi:hypothetical protein
MALNIPNYAVSPIVFKGKKMTKPVLFDRKVMILKKTQDTTPLKKQYFHKTVESRSPFVFTGATNVTRRINIHTPHNLDNEYYVMYPAGFEPE